MSVCFACTYVCAACTGLVLKEARKQHWILHVGAGNQIQVLGKTASALNC